MFLWLSAVCSKRKFLCFHNPMLSHIAFQMESKSILFERALCLYVHKFFTFSRNLVFCDDFVNETHFRCLKRLTVQIDVYLFGSMIELLSTHYDSKSYDYNNSAIVLA